eukprot:TRINITY_DN3122_c0_g1_i5.p2 TRINITY_DN3122_c0_g1~~TRINITY_DN3122_c0_g1_i5.p2  ORF type:complete len:100 (+),score=27.87 TRINITY_DN3122_c0_g1_i5:27-326(+)
MSSFFFFQAEDGIRDLVRSRGLGDVYKRQVHDSLDFHFECLTRTIKQQTKPRQQQLTPLQAASVCFLLTQQPGRSQELCCPIHPECRGSPLMVAHSRQL